MSQTRNLGGGGRSAVVVPPDVPSRLLLGAQCSLPLLGDEAKAKLAPLLSYESVVVVAGSVLALLAASTMGLGLAVDVILGVAAVAVIGSEAIEACRRLGVWAAEGKSLTGDGMGDALMRHGRELPPL